MAAGEQDDLREEIEMLRGMIHKVSELAEESDNLQVSLRLMEAISRAGSRLANMIKTQQMLQGGPQINSLSEPLKQIIADITKNR